MMRWTQQTDGKPSVNHFLCLYKPLVFQIIDLCEPSLQGAQVRNEKLKLEARKEQGAVHVAMELLKEKVFSEIGEKHPEIAATLADAFLRAA